MRIKTTYLFFALLLLLIAPQPPTPVQAATIAVTTTDDEVNNDGDCSLREAIIAANSDSAVDSCPAGDGADHIELPTGTYTLTITGASNDDATRGDLDISDELTITGAGRAATIIDANGDDRAMHILPGAGSVEISRLTVRGSHPSYTGAVLVEGSLNLVSSRVSQNADFGIAVYTNGVLNVVNSRIYDNEQGGLLLTQNATATVLNSAISGNSGYGGAGISNAGYLFIVNSTISGNNASNNGGGIYNAHQLADTVLINTTVTGNIADASDGGGIDSEWGTTTVKNSIIAGNLRDGGAQPSDCSGSMESEGYNLIQSTSGCTITGNTTANMTGVDPMLGPLKDNGGPTVTHALLDGSPTIDAGDPAGCVDAAGALLTTDQRGYVRPVDGGSGNRTCDIGAFEYDSGGPRPVAFTVTYTDDDGDSNPGDARCDVFAAQPGNQCSLRGAIEEINALGSGDAPTRIDFDIPGGVPGLFRPGSPLPEIKAPVIIDGASQRLASCPTATTPANLLIILNGSLAGSGTNGLRITSTAGGSTIRGLVIGDFDGSGIHVATQSEDNHIECNHIGIGADGVSNRGNGNGVQIWSANNVIGGEDVAQRRNVISGNEEEGVYLASGAKDNLVTNNFIGTTADGMSGLGNGTGLEIYANQSGNVIGGIGMHSRNVISGNLNNGITSSGQNTLIQGNFIGVAYDGVTTLPNQGSGISILGNSTNLIGGIDAHQGNVIAHNGSRGVLIYTNAVAGTVPYQNEVRGNSIHDNAGLGIDLETDGVDSNDPGDGDDGANGRQNYPVLHGTLGSTAVGGTLDSASNSTFRIDVYRNDSCDGSGHGEGQEYLQTIEVVTDGDGIGDFNIDVPPTAVSPGDYVTATATDADGNTSEFSACVQLDFVPPPPATATATPTVTSTPGPSPTPRVTGTPNSASEQHYLPLISR